MDYTFSAPLMLNTNNNNLFWEMECWSTAQADWCTQGHTRRLHLNQAFGPQVFALHFYQQNQIQQVWKSLGEVVFLTLLQRTK